MKSIELSLKISNGNMEIENQMNEKTLKISTEDEIGKKFVRIVKGELSSIPKKELASEEKVSRMTYYRDKKKYEQNGLSGLIKKKRRPKKPSKVDEQVEQMIVWYRFHHKELNHEQITDTVNKELQRKGKKPITSRATSKVLNKHHISKKNLKRRLTQSLK